jgi:hypothetical protein
MEVRIYGRAGGAVSEDDDGIGKPDGETGGDEGVGWMRKVISTHPYILLTLILPSNIIK